jgi:DNA-binding transcriptional LysR family regulator
MRSSGFVELDAVLAVARTGSFRAAAAELGMSRTALSSAVASLEKRLAVRLFHRTTRSVSLTEAGERFVGDIAPALAQIRGAMTTASTGRATPSGTLRLNCSPGAAQRIITPTVFEYVRRYPEVKVDLVTEGRLIDIVAGGFDAGIRLAEDVPRDMVSVPLGLPLRFNVVGAPALFKQAPPPTKPADLRLHPCIRARRASGEIYRWEFTRRGRALSVDVEGPLTLDAPVVMRAAACAGAGLAYLPEWFVEDDLRAGRLVRVLEEWTPPAGELCLYYPSHRYVPAKLRAFVEVARDRARQKARSSKLDDSADVGPRRGSRR